MEIEDRDSGDNNGDDDMDFFLSAVAQSIINNIVVMIHYLRCIRCKQQQFRRLQAVEQVLFPPDHRHLPRRQKAILGHHEAFVCIQRDYLGIPGDLTTPVFKDQTFQMMFRLSRSCVQRIFEDITAENNPFYSNSTDATGQEGASLEAVLLPLKRLHTES